MNPGERQQKNPTTIQTETNTTHDLKNELFDDLPHPGPLPKEREKRSPRFWNFMRQGLARSFFASQQNLLPASPLLLGARWIAGEG